jgi:hypothetical protein
MCLFPVAKGIHIMMPCTPQRSTITASIDSK